jgi:hypothetical protein
MNHNQSGYDWHVFVDQDRWHVLLSCPQEWIGDM